jgi:hypothetical protein
LRSEVAFRMAVDFAEEADFAVEAAVEAAEVAVAGS